MRKIIVICFLVLVAAGCQTSGTFNQTRIRAFEQFDAAFAKLDPADFELIELEGCTKIFVYGNKRDLRTAVINLYANSKAEPTANVVITSQIDIQGYFIARKNKTAEIHILGALINDKIYINEAILGHEILHIINATNSRFINPDDGLY